MSDVLAPANADPSRYDLYDCEQLANERKSLATQIEDFKRLMAKAETGAGGSVVAEMVYGPDYAKTVGQVHLADEAWQRNKCADHAAAPAHPS
ncbi:hypothetical protein [Bradyrhizobium brasilense]|uniref:hypothetical protein n=1 Tax=Bradyrhizobium brasilense TaxID=1419277 RepID=UPI00117788AB|nr:hypothetical protein [Bradyrhizobium brasilense]